MKEYFSMLNSEIFEFLDLLLLNEIDKAIKSNSKLMLSIAYPAGARLTRTILNES